MLNTLSTSEKIPSVGFHPRKTGADGIELIDLRRILESKGKLDHDSEKPHQLEFYNIFCFTAGESRHLIDFEYYPIRPGSIVYLAKGQVSAFSLVNDMRGYGLLFTQKYVEDNFSHLSGRVLSQLFNHQLYEPVIQQLDATVFLQYMELMKYELAQKNDPGRAATVSSLFSIILSKVLLMRRSKALIGVEDQKLQLVAQFSGLVQEEYRLSRNADHFARKLLITYKHLNACCKEVFNKTAKQVIDEYVILEAKRRLVNLSVQTAEIAYELGFEEPTNFTKYFKKLTGMTPRQFKEANSQ